MKNYTSSTSIDDAYAFSMASAFLSSFYFLFQNRTASFECNLSKDPAFQLMVARSLAAQKSSLANLPEEKRDEIQENAQDFAYRTFKSILSADLPQEDVIEALQVLDLDNDLDEDVLSSISS